MSRAETTSLLKQLQLMASVKRRQDAELYKLQHRVMELEQQLVLADVSSPALPPDAASQPINTHTVGRSPAAPDWALTTRARVDALRSHSRTPC